MNELVDTDSVKMCLCALPCNLNSKNRGSTGSTCYIATETEHPNWGLFF